MFVFDYSDCSDLISDVLMATEGDLVFSVVEELTDEGLYTQRVTSKELNRFCRKALTIGIITAIVYNTWREHDDYYDTMLTLVVRMVEEYMHDLIDLDIMYEEDGIAYESPWAAFVPDTIPFNIRATDDITDVAEIIGGLVVDTVHEVHFFDDPIYRSLIRGINRKHTRTLDSASVPPRLEIDMSNRIYTLHYPSQREDNTNARSGLRH